MKRTAFSAHMLLHWGYCAGRQLLALGSRARAAHRTNGPRRTLGCCWRFPPRCWWSWGWHLPGVAMRLPRSMFWAFLCCARRAFCSLAAGHLLLASAAAHAPMWRSDNGFFYLCAYDHRLGVLLVLAPQAELPRAELCLWRLWLLKTLRISVWRYSYGQLEALLSIWRDAWF